MQKSKGERRKVKKLLALVIIGALVLSAIPALAFYPGPGDMPEFCMKIDGEWTEHPDHPLIFEGIHYCTTFEVEVIIMDAKDLYAYSFTVTWTSTAPCIELVDSEVKSIHTDDFVIHTDSGDGYYEQAVTAIAPAEGFTGTAAVANLYFHIYNDAQWPCQIDIIFEIDGEMSDSCGEPPEDWSEQGGYVKLVPVQPTIKMLPPVVIKSVVGETFEVQFEIQDVVKMKSFHFDVTWCAEQITTDAQNVWVKDFLPPPYEHTFIDVWEYEVDDCLIGVLTIVVEMPCEKPSINGTGELFGIRFTTLDPWDGTIPPYYQAEDEEDHPPWYPGICCNWINIDGYIDKGCGCTYHEQHLGDPDGVTVKGPDAFDYDDDPETKFIYDEPCWMGWPGYIIGYYEFRPIPGDLNLDGHVDIEDLSAIAKCYGCDDTMDCWDDPDAPCSIFDLDEDGDIDIYDVIIVAKNFCRTEPDPVNPWPLFDP